MNRATLYAIGVALLVFVGWLKFFHDPGIREAAALEARAHVTDSLAVLQAAELVKDSLATARLTDSLARHVVTRTVIKARTDTVTVTLREALPDTLKPVLDSLTALHAARVASLEADLSAVTFRLVVKDSLLAADVVLRQRLVSERNAFAKEAGKKWHLVAGVGVVANQQGAGPGVFLGLARAF